MTRKLGLAAGTLAIAGFAAFFAASAAAQSATPAAQSATPAALEDQLKTKFKPAKLGSRGQVVLDPGTVLTIQKGGLVGISPWLIVVCPSTYKDGKMHSPNAICLLATHDVTHDLTVNEKVYVESIGVDEKKDKIELEVVECDSCNGKRSAYKAKIAFQFSKGQLKATGIDKVAGVIGEVFAVDSSSETTSESTQQAKTEQVKPSQPVDAQTAVNQTVSQPSQPPADPATPAQPIQVGQTLEEVQANIGVKLNATADLGNKQIYRYNGQKIIVENGKVTEIQ